MSSFMSKHAAKLAAYIHMSRTAGARSDYVQGGGGNTSVKVDDRLMAIKASGFRLEQIAEADAYAVLDYAALRGFYEGTDPATLDDVEAAGSARAKAVTQTIEGLPQLRPSVEAGFHSLLDTFVLHTHPVYANLATCSVEGAAVAAEALADLPERHAFVPYINPGAQLTFAIGRARHETQAKTGRPASILFLQNHGLVITGDDEAACLALNDEVNRRIARAYGVSEDDWPVVAIESAGAEDLWASATPWLKGKLLNTDWNLDFFTKQSLYPDQLVFLAGQMAVVERGGLADARAAGTQPPVPCTVFRETGEVLYACKRAAAQTVEETLCAILFIVGAIARSGRTLCTMDESGKNFIAGWESEKYRQTVASR
ncbi:MAG: class II aldolase/adducin family protein [Kiritimatiellia bacterium]|jgi:ribulose-5-phosphate 4-epimerase/fuculose-1-phosphate aldolase